MQNDSEIIRFGFEFGVEVASFSPLKLQDIEHQSYNLLKFETEDSDNIIQYKQ